MKVISEIELSDFNFWSGAKSRAASLTDRELNAIGEALEAEYPDGMTDSQINDMFWFDFPFVCGLIGIELNEDEERVEEEA